MRKQKRQMCVRRMLLFFLACVLICAAPPSVAQAAIMQTAKNSTVQKKKTSTKTVTIETSGEITKKKVKSGGSVILPVEVNKRGYTFLGWSTVPGQTCNPMYQAYQKIQVTKNIHLYPVSINGIRNRIFMQAVLRTVWRNMIRLFLWEIPAQQCFAVL